MYILKLKEQLLKIQKLHNKQTSSLSPNMGLRRIWYKCVNNSAVIRRCEPTEKNILGVLSCDMATDLDFVYSCYCWASFLDYRRYYLSSDLMHALNTEYPHHPWLFHNTSAFLTSGTHRVAFREKTHNALAFLTSGTQRVAFR